MSDDATAETGSRSPPDGCIVVFGGTGYLGGRIVARLLSAGCRVRVVSRHAGKADLPAAGAGRIEILAGDLRESATLEAALSGAWGAVNAVSLYHERGNATFQAIHVAAAGRLAAAARRKGVERLVHLSGIGADPAARSPYVRSRGAGERAVLDAFETASIFRPSALFGGGAGLLDSLATVVRRAPLVPLFGRGETRLQPVHVEDVAEAARIVLLDRRAPRPLLGLGGPEILSYRRLLERTMEAVGRRRPMLPLPFALWHALAALLKPLPGPPVTEGMVALMREDNVVPDDLPDLESLAIVPRSLAAGFQELADRPATEPEAASPR